MKLIGGSLAIGLIIFLLIFILFAISFTVLEIIGKWKLLKKAGKSGWEAIIPYYNTWVLVEISGCKWWLFLIIIFSSCISLNISYMELANIKINSVNFIGTSVNFFAMLCVNYNISKKCNKDIAFAIGLTMLPFVFYPILGFNNTSFNNDVKVSPYGVIKEGDR